MKAFQIDATHAGVKVQGAIINVDFQVTTLPMIGETHNAMQIHYFRRMMQIPHGSLH
jgi:hypothetical protein